MVGVALCLRAYPYLRRAARVAVTFADGTFGGPHSILWKALLRGVGWTGRHRNLELVTYCAVISTTPIAFRDMSDAPRSLGFRFLAVPGPNTGVHGVDDVTLVALLVAFIASSRWVYKCALDI